MELNQERRNHCSPLSPAELVFSPAPVPPATAFPTPPQLAGVKKNPLTSLAMDLKDRQTAKTEEKSQGHMRGEEQARAPSLPGSLRGALLTRWPQSCPPPSPHSSGHGLPGPLAALTHSSSSPLRS